MRRSRRLLIWSLITLGTGAAPVLLTPAGWRYATAIGAVVGTATPSYVLAGVPFVVRDDYTTLICVSTRAGRPLPPFEVPASAAYLEAGTTGRVQAGVPFMVRDNYGTQVCVSARGGQAYPPYIRP